MDELDGYIRERFKELQASFDKFATQIRDLIGEHAVSIARLQMRAEQQDRALEEVRREHAKALDVVRVEHAAALAEVRRDNDRVNEATGRKVAELREERRFHIDAWIGVLAVIVGAASAIALFLHG